MEELKKCPFCGGEAELCKGSGEWYWVVCTICDITQWNTHDKQEAIKAWNKRTKEA